MKLGNNFLPFEAGVVKGAIYGGPFRDYVPGTRRLVGVKMAQEINHPHEISIPTHDFSVPDRHDMHLGLHHAISMIAQGNDVYAGCMGGVGRTGLFMGVAAKVLIDYHGGQYLKHSDPVKLVRIHFKRHAIETDEQQAYVRDWDTEPAVVHLHSLQPLDRNDYVPSDHFAIEMQRMNRLVQQAQAEAQHYRNLPYWRRLLGLY